MSLPGMQFKWQLQITLMSGGPEKEVQKEHTKLKLKQEQYMKNQ